MIWSSPELSDTAGLARVELELHLVHPEARPGGAAVLHLDLEGDAGRWELERDAPAYLPRRRPERARPVRERAVGSGAGGVGFRGERVLERERTPAGEVIVEVDVSPALQSGRGDPFAVQAHPAAHVGSLDRGLDPDPVRILAGDVG